MRMTARITACGLGFVVLGANAAPTQEAVVSEIVVRPGEPVPASVEGVQATMRVLSAGPDRLLLDPEFVARTGISAASIFGNANLNVAGRREFKGKNRPLSFVVGGVPHKGRAFWFADAPGIDGDATIGPWAMPQPRVTMLFGASGPSDKRYDFPLFGQINSSSLTIYREASFGTAVGFDLDDSQPYPVASAATGAAIAKAYGGQLSGASWDIEILMGVKRPVRLMTLARPMAIGPVSFSQIAVRVRDRIDGAGRGDAISDGTEDPAEIVVAAKKRGRQPIFSMSLPKAVLAGCSRLTFDKPAKRIELWCQPA